MEQVPEAAALEELHLDTGQKGHFLFRCLPRGVLQSADILAILLVDAVV